ncbi:MAG: 2-amino-4-hydroxy-6-hydroxymethyldihydropteridine diphosphokinase [Woeseiaceae bacterium]
MARVYLGLGSNIDAERHLRLGIEQLRQRFGELELSTVYRNRSVGFDGDDFLNMVVGFESEASPAAIQTEIERIHALAGRQRGEAKYASRTLDIDLLLYDDLVTEVPGLRLPRPDVLEYGFVLRPLTELAPEMAHPVTGRTMLEHWQAFDADSESLTAIDLNLQ